ncbi:RraA family protein [Membranihabitans maritimus]|uniref:RraA family protein n=1 Tax=Membranihabitans maritimus TaxID=2904244 RepID=UPI001F431AC4|nr:RraA family protein [Membranihabitans maritimus]
MNVDFDKLTDTLYSAVICDALDSLGYKEQSPRIQLEGYTGVDRLMGRCKTTLWVDMYHEDPEPYELELKAVDSCQSGDVLIAAAGGSVRSGIWGELLSTAAKNSGCRGAIIHGAIRDIDKMRNMGFPVFAASRCVYDSQNRQRVVDIDIEVEIDGVSISPGDIVFADRDGVVFIPQKWEEEVLKRALEKVSAENVTRDAIKGGMKAMEAYEKYGVL